MEGGKYMVLSFKNHNDFEVCNKLMKVNVCDIGTSANGLFVVIVKTDNILVPHGNLSIKTTEGRQISVRITSGVVERVSKVTFGNSTS